MKLLNKLFLILTILISVFLLTSCNTKGEYEDAMTFSDDLAGVKLRGLYGFIDMEGNLKIKPSYEQVQSFYDGTALVKQNGLWGLIDKTNTVIIPFKYTEASMISGDLISVKENDKFGCINLKGEIVVDFISSDEIQIYCGNDNNNIAIITDNNKKGFIDLDTGFKVPPIYNGISYIYDKSNLVTLVINDKSGNLNAFYANLDTQTIIEAPYQDFLYFQSDLAAILINFKYGYANKANEIVIAPIYDSASNFSEGLATVTINRKSGCINTKGEIVIPLIYDYVDPFYKDIARISFNNKLGIINTKGEILCEPKFLSINLYGDSDIIPAAYVDDHGNSKYVCINKYGETLFETNYTDISPFNNSSQAITQVHKNDKIGYINRKGIEILSPIYDKALNIGDLFIVNIDNKYGLIGKYQKELLKCEYTSITNFSENIFSISKDNKYGLYNATTNTFTELLYDEMRFPHDEVIPVRIGDKWHYIDLDGNKL
ncbi:MAG: WG repeat-containing protein [Clostridium sp.]|uniref:WG repeat-containing protein n=1 Tax=Clostridium sp. TaxID=1506 RepID=UPI003073B92F